MAGARSPPTVALAFFGADRRSLPRCRRYEASGFGIIGSRMALAFPTRPRRLGRIGVRDSRPALRSLTAASPSRVVITVTLTEEEIADIVEGISSFGARHKWAFKVCRHPTNP